MELRNDLKVEFKAESFGTTGTYHVLMYRISPDQNLTYYKEQSFLGLKYNVKKKFDASWHRADRYLNYPSSERYSKLQLNPVLFRKIEEFEEWKTNCKTIGDFFARLDEINTKENESWKLDREKYLNHFKTWR